MQNKTLTIYWGILWILFSITAFAQLPVPKIIYNDGRKSNDGDIEKIRTPEQVEMKLKDD